MVIEIFLIFFMLMHCWLSNSGHVRCSVGLEFPKVEVRFQNLKVDALVQVGSRALPTIPNFIFDMTEVNMWRTKYPKC